MSDELVSEAALTLQLKQGSQEALASLIARHRPRLIKIIRFRLDHRLGSRVSEFDVLQDTFVRAAKRIDHFSQAAPSLNAFLWLRLLVNQQLSELNRRHFGAGMRDVRKEVSIDAQATSGSTSQALAQYLLAAKLETPSQIMGQQEELDRVEAMLNQLSQFDQEMIALRHFEELTNAEAAAVLQIEPVAARKRYHRALHRLRDRMTTNSDQQSTD